MQYPRVKFGDLYEIIGGGTPSIHNEDYYGGDIPWATVRDMNCKVISSTERRITDRGLKESASNVIPAGNLIIATRVGLGKVCYLAQDTAINQDLKGLMPKSSKIFKDFTYYWLLAISDNIISNGIGATVKGVKLDFIANLKMPLPPLPVQQEIVAKLEKELAKVDEMADGFKRMVELADEEFKAALSETVEHVEGKSVKLGDICSKLSTGPFGSVLHKNDYVENGIPLVNPMHIIGDSIVPSHDMTVSVETAKRLEAYKLSQGDIVIGRRGEMGRAAVVTSKEEGWLCGTGSFFLHLKQHIEPEFFLLCFKSPKCIHQMVNTAKGATMQNLNHGLLKSLELILPSKETQLKIVKDITLAKERCKKLISYSQRSLFLCTELRKSILQEAFA